MEALVVIALLAVVVLVVSAPLRHGATAREVDGLREARADLEAAKAAKYREIRDAEIDHRTGKLSDADWRAVDRELRAEAIEILHQLDALGEDALGEPAPEPADAAAPEPAHPAGDPADRAATRGAGAPRARR